MQKWPRKFDWKDASEDDFSWEPGTGEECPLKDRRLCGRGPPLTMDQWGAGGHSFPEGEHHLP